MKHLGSRDRYNGQPARLKFRPGLTMLKASNARIR